MTQTVEPWARSLRIPVEVSAAFNESHSDGWFEPDRCNSIVADFFADPNGPPAPGWEPAAEAADRFLSALGEVRTRHGDGTIAVCSGGRVLTAVLDRLGLVPTGAVLETWRRIPMPDVAVVELGSAGRPLLLRPFGGTSRSREGI